MTAQEITLTCEKGECSNSRSAVIAAMAKKPSKSRFWEISFLG